MPGYIGTSLNIQWLYLAGTNVLSGDYLTANYAPSVDMIDETAGADTNHLYLAAQKDGKFTASGNLQGAAIAGGTIMGTALVEGFFGTLVWSPEGTGAGKAKYTLPAFSQGLTFDYAYNDLVKWKCDFQASGARVDGTN